MKTESKQGSLSPLIPRSRLKNSEEDPPCKGYSVRKKYSSINRTQPLCNFTDSSMRRQQLMILRLGAVVEEICAKQKKKNIFTKIRNAFFHATNKSSLKRKNLYVEITFRSFRSEILDVLNKRKISSIDDFARDKLRPNQIKYIIKKEETDEDYYLFFAALIHQLVDHICTEEFEKLFLKEVEEKKLHTLEFEKKLTSTSINVEEIIHKYDLKNLKRINRAFNFWKRCFISDSCTNKEYNEFITNDIKPYTNVIISCEQEDFSLDYLNLPKEKQQRKKLWEEFENKFKEFGSKKREMVVKAISKHFTRKEGFDDSVTNIVQILHLYDDFYN